MHYILVTWENIKSHLNILPIRFKIYGTNPLLSVSNLQIFNLNEKVLIIINITSLLMQFLKCNYQSELELLILVVFSYKLISFTYRTLSCKILLKSVEAIKQKPWNDFTTTKGKKLIQILFLRKQDTFQQYKRREILCVNNHERKL